MDGASTGVVVGTGPGMRIRGSGYGEQEVWAGVIYVRIPATPDGERVAAFCIDLAHPIRVGDEFTAADPTPCQITWILENYPPGPDLTDEEAAARQAAVWWFSDGFTVSSSSPEVRALAEEIIAAVPSPCILPQEAPELTIDPAFSSVVLPETTQDFVVRAEQDGSPLVGLEVELAVDGGHLSDTVVYTNGDGEAEFSVIKDSGEADAVTILATAEFALPRGTVFEPVIPDKQKLVLASPVTGSAFAEASAVWYEPGSIVAHKFIDLNLNGEQDPGEESYTGWKIYLYRDRELLDTQLTDAAGNAVFSDLSPGTYLVSEALPAGWRSTLPPAREVVLDSGDAALVVFGNIRLPAVTVRKFHDLDGDGERDAGEPLLDGWEFTLYREDHAIEAAGSTEDGTVTFSGLTVGDHLLEESLLPGWVCTTGVTVSLDLGPMDHVSIDFGNRMAPTGTPASTATPSASPTPTPMASPTPTPVDTGTPAPTAPPTATPTPQWSPTPTVPGTATAAPSSTPSATATPTATPTPTPQSGTPTPTPRPKLAEVAVGCYNSQSGADEVQIYVIDEYGLFSPPSLVVLQATATGDPVNAPPISGQITDLWSGDLAGDGFGNSYMDLAVATDAHLPGEPNLYIFLNGTLSGSISGLNYTCVGAHHIGVSPDHPDRIAALAAADVNHDWDNELILAVNTLDGEAGHGMILVYDLLPGAELGARMEGFTVTFPSRILALATGDFRGDNPMWRDDDIVVVTEPVGASPDGDVVHFLESNGRGYQRRLSMDLGDVLPVAVGVGEFVSFMPWIQEGPHVDFVFASEGGQVRWYVNNWDRTDLHPDLQDPSLYTGLQPDLPGVLSGLTVSDALVPGDYDDVLVSLRDVDIGADRIYLYRCEPQQVITLQQSGAWGVKAIRATTGYMNSDPGVDLLYCDNADRSMNIVLRDLYSDSWQPAINESIEHSGGLIDVVVTQHQNGHSPP
jgi:hypothetical protein